MKTTTVGSVLLNVSMFTGQRRGSGRARDSRVARQHNKATFRATCSPGDQQCAGMALGAYG